VNRSKLLVLLIVVVILGIVVLALGLRQGMRCAGFPGGGVTAAELPPPTATGDLRFAAFNIRNFPLDERADDPELGFSRRTNICDLEEVLAGLDAQVLGFAEICDTRRFPPILRRSSGDRPMKIRFSQDGGRGGQHLAIAWDGSAFEPVGEPVELTEVVVKPGLRPALAIRLRSIAAPAFDFTVVQVHLDSGLDDYDSRLRQLRALAAWLRSWVARTGDPDVVVLGDFNTMGSRELGPDHELEQVDGILDGAGLHRVVNATGCTEYWEGPGEPDGVHRASLLDLVYVRGLEPRGPARSWLHCERLACGELVSRPGQEDATYYDVSDHCPVTFEVAAGGG
jgi:hypothetical protein